MNQTDFLDLEAMRNIDIRTVDPDTLADIRDVQIDMSKSLRERMLDYIQQINNPYCFRCGKMTVKVSYADTDITMEERMEGYFRSL